MSVTVAMHEASLAHIRSRLDALGLDIRLVTFNAEGQFTVDGKTVPAGDVAADYVWLSSHVHQGGGQKAAFDTLLKMKQVKVLQTFNAGLDAPFYKQAAARGIVICNSSAQAVAIAEYTLGQVMNVLQPFALQRAQQAEKTWKVTPYREISRTHWLIVGYGAIGSEAAKRAKAFGAKISAIRRSPTTDDVVNRAGGPDKVIEFLPDADVILLSCPLTDATRGLAGKRFFAAAKPGAILVNIGRGGLVDDAALIAALDSGRIERAILDVFHTEPLPTDDPYWSHPKVNLTPHTSFAGDGVQGRWDQLFLDNIARYVRGEPLGRVVDPADI